MQIRGDWITGCMVGFEFLREEDACESHLIIDLFIMRVIFTVYDDGFDGFGF